MDILIILFLLMLLFFSLLLLYKIVRWILRKKTRIYWTAFLLSIFLFTKTINHLFFTKMEFIQSNVYPNLYLVKNELKNRDSLNNSIKKRVIKKINNGLVNNGEIYSENTYKAPYATLAFYTYSKNTIFSVFQNYGTAYFIDNEEDLGGISVEDLLMYSNDKLATFNIRHYKNDTTRLCGILEYYKNGYVVKTDTLNNNYKPYKTH